MKKVFASLVLGLVSICSSMASAASQCCTCVIDLGDGSIREYYTVDPVSGNGCYGLNGRYATFRAGTTTDSGSPVSWGYIVSCNGPHTISNTNMCEGKTIYQ